MSGQDTTLITQRILAERADGHNAAGISGDCFRACVATILARPYDEVPHFVLYVSWWSYARQWARDRGGDFACWYFDDWHVRLPKPEILRPLFIATGLSPRGGFNHCVVVDEGLNIIHDPHPSRAGLASDPVDIIAFTRPYDPAPEFTMLEAAK